ncbi:sensor histidine kinase [Ruania halotolerans]|uniref:sensor histidine kinase n=1 Tax=Ruania halotolerans TaxID=2897773 RepID=UPI001E328A14|nr:histidine kinase [Ruania halotolerans]UFU05073.1 histidine kinase [Ruania halotolerans]
MDRRGVRSWWNAPAADPRPPQRVWRDWALLAIVPVLVAVETLLRTDIPSQWPWAVLLVAVLPATLWRRRYPTAVLTTALGAGIVAGQLISTDLALVSAAYLLVLVYTVPRWGSVRSVLAGAVLLAIAVLAPSAVGAAPWVDAWGSAAVVLTTSTLGLAFRWRASSRARELERVRLLEGERLARDLHDTVAHHVSAIAIRAQAGRTAAASDPAAATDALQVIEEEASRALDEMRSIVRILRREDEPELAPLPGIADLSTLARSGTTVPVEVTITGNEAAVSPHVGAATYRIAQEALTNIRRHAQGATRALLTLRIDALAVHLEISDDGRLTHDPPSRGYGIAGMTERAALLGGRCIAGPGQTGGWIVTAALPLTGSPE